MSCVLPSDEELAKEMADYYYEFIDAENNYLASFLAISIMSTEITSIKNTLSELARYKIHDSRTSKVLKHRLRYLKAANKKGTHLHACVCDAILIRRVMSLL